MQIRIIKTTNEARTSAGQQELEGRFEVPESIAEASELWGEEVVLANAIQSVIIGYQSATRSKMRANKDGEVKSDETITEEMAAWKPQLRSAAKSKVEKAADMFKGLSDDDRAAAVAQLQELLQGGDSE